jgi:hypothetical protein
MPASPRPALPFAAIALALGCGAQDLPPPPPPPPTPTPPSTAAAFQPAAVAPPIATEGTITRITAREQVPLTGPRVDAKPGDWLLENAGSVAVVAADGRVVDFGPRGGRDELTAVEPTAFLGFSSVHVEVETVELASEGHVLHVVRRVLEKPLFLHTFVSFSGDRLRIEIAATARSPAAATLAVTLGERVGWGNVPTWAEGHGFITRGGTVITDFIARESFGVSYALCSEGGHLLAKFDNPDSGFHEEASTGETPELIPLDAPSTRRVIALTHGTGSLGRAAQALPCKTRPGAQHVKPPEGLSPETRVEVAHCGKVGRAPAPYTRSWAGDGELTLPDGCFQMRLTAPGHTSSAWFSTSAAFGRTLPAAGRLRFSVTEKGGGAIPARVLVRGVKSQPDPSWGDDPNRGAALNVVYAETGEGERPVPPGKYKVTVDRGFEYTAVEKEITVVAGKTTELAAELERVVDTKGFIAADLHLHAMPSPDAPQPLADRVRALVAGGIEVGVATDHNKVTDYKPVIAELKVGRWLASIVGDEVTTRDPAYGHFNAFPLPAGAEPIPYRTVTPAAIFAAARAAGSLGPDTVVQVNHPRMGGIGYFDLLRFDREDVAGWHKRVPLADLSFDAIEVFNGDHYALINKVEECMRDWYALLDAGHRVTATGNSDSHKLAFHEAGVPRNLVAVAKDDPAALDERAFIEAVRRGRVVVSSGPFIRLEAGGKGIGETIPAGQTEIGIVVDAPPWVDLDRVELVRRGELIGIWNGPFQKGKPKGPHRFEISTSRALEKGDWIIAIARGTKPMTYLHRPNARPFAFTNPIWVQ